MPVGRVIIEVLESLGEIDGPALAGVGIEYYDGCVLGRALDENGQELACHLSSNLAWLSIDLGADGPHRDKYAARYPDGFEVVAP